MTDLVLAGCAIFKDKSIILLHRKKTGWYELPGGKLEPKEDPKTGAIRELKEELGCDVEIIKKLGSKEFEEYGQNLLYHWFQARLKPGHDFQICEKEKFDHFKWIRLDALKDYKLSPNMENFLHELENFEIQWNKG